MSSKVKNLQQVRINDACHSSNNLQPNTSDDPNTSALYYQDITQERQKARFCLGFLSSLVEGMMDTVLVVNPKTGLVEYANKAALRMFDCQFEDLIDHSPDIFCPLETRLKFHEEIIRASLNEIGWEGEVKSVRKSGEPFTSWLRSFILKDEGGLTWMLVIVQRDLTAEKSFQGRVLSTSHSSNEQLVQAVELSAIEQRARETAHELNNLATILYGYIDLMLLKKNLPCDLEKDLKAIQNIGKKATVIARQLLNLKQLQEGKKTITELAPLIEETLQIVSKELSKQGIQMEIIHHQDTSLLLDPTQISQVLLNLCINAQQAMAEAPRKVLRIETGQDTGFAFLKISDTGCGISKENQNKIFQPFFTTKGNGDVQKGMASRKKECHLGFEMRYRRSFSFSHSLGATASEEKGSGTGLGLTVVKKIIEDHGGSIKVQSRVGEGTVFIIHLPLPVPDTGQINAPSHPQRTTPSYFQGKMILIVDDEYSIRQLVKKALELQGARVDAVGAGEEGFEMIRQKKYDLVLLDLQLQDMSGERLMDLINSIPEPARPIKMVMSGKAGEMSQSLLNGFDVSAVLRKPFELQDLYAKISTALGNQ